MISGVNLWVCFRSKEGVLSLIKGWVWKTVGAANIVRDTQIPDIVRGGGGYLLWKRGLKAVLKEHLGICARRRRRGRSDGRFLASCIRRCDFVVKLD